MKSTSVKIKDKKKSKQASSYNVKDENHAPTGNL